MTKRMWKLLPANIRRRLKVQDGHWLWTGVVNGPWLTAGWGGGYGYAWVDRRMVRVHRVVYTLLVGPIPEGEVLMHVQCSIRRCCRPNHLEPGTVSANAQEREDRRYA